MNQRFTMVAGTIRQNISPTKVVDVPTIIRLDTQTGEGWYLEGNDQRFLWISIEERGVPPAH